MSAIGAIFHRDGRPVERRALDRMRAGLRLHGPDRDGIEADGCIGLVWTHSIGFTPHDRNEFQPIALEGGRMLAFAGWLDHRDDLVAALGLDRGEARALPDGELVRRAWQAWDERAPERLEGRFAIIVADPARRRLIALRSPLNGHPLHFFETSDRLVVASMPKGLFALGDVPRELDDQRIADSLVLNYEDREASFFRDIRSLPLGHRLVAGPGWFSVERYYELRDAPLVRFARDEHYVERARELLDGAVASAMRSVDTPALSLSSGLDSAMVAVTAHDLLARSEGEARPLLALTAIPEPGWDGRTFGAGRVGDESGPVRALLELYPGIEGRFVTSEGLSLDHGLDALQAAAEMPLRGVLNLHWGLEIRRLMRLDGRRVTLSGASGNFTLSMSAANHVLAGRFRSGRWLSLLRELHALNRRRGNRRRLGLSGLVSRAIAPNLPDAAYRALKRLRPDNFESGWQRHSAIRADYAGDMRVEERMAELGWDDHYRQRIDRRELLFWRLDRGGRGRSGAAHLAMEAVSGIQGRDPLGDRRLVEYCTAIPDEQFFGGGIDRLLARRLLAGRVPEAILAAPRGRQAADWHLRLKRDVARFDEELEILGEDPDVARRIDIERMRAALRALPEATPLTRNDHPDLAVAMVAIPRAVAAARFIRSVTGRNR